MERVYVTVSESTKKRLEEYAAARGVSQGSVVDDALRNFFDRADRKTSAPDLVLERINTLVMSVMQLNMTAGRIEEKLDQMGGDS